MILASLAMSGGSLRRQLLATVRTALGKHFAPTGGRFAGAKAVAALSHDLAGLISALRRHDLRPSKGRLGSGAYKEIRL